MASIMPGINDGGYGAFPIYFNIDVAEDISSTSSFTSIMYRVSGRIYSATKGRMPMQAVPMSTLDHQLRIVCEPVTYGEDSAVCPGVRSFRHFSSWEQMYTMLSAKSSDGIQLWKPVDGAARLVLITSSTLAKETFRFSD